MSELVLPIPCTKVDEKTVKDWFQKINEEMDELKTAVTDVTWLHKEPNDVQNWLKTDLIYNIADEAADTITAIISMLEAMGIDEDMRQAAQKRVNEKNKERGRF